jgi:hypothetical protein
VPPRQLYELRGCLYVLAERIRDVQTKNLVIEEIKTKTDVRNHLTAYLKMAAYIYNGTPGPCALRELLVDLLAKSSSHSTAKDGVDNFKSKLRDLPQDFLMDLVFGLYTKRAIDYKAASRVYYNENLEPLET